MSFANHNHPVSGRVVRQVLTLLLALAAITASPAALALDSGDIVIANLKGEVHFEVRGASAALRSGSVLELPATLRTGRDGAVELRQGATSISVGPDTLLEFPALETRGGPIDRIVQPRGNAFYSIGKRSGRKLRVETPFLVGVVKGTQFNVAAQDHSTTISLFEGLLEVRSADGIDVIDLRAGEIASRDRTADDISVFKMEGNKAPPVQKPSAGAGPGSVAPSPSAPAAVPASKPATTPAPIPAPRIDTGDSVFAGHGRGNAPVVVIPEEALGASHSGVALGIVDERVDLGVKGNSGEGNGNSATVDLGVGGNSGNGNSIAPTVDLGVSGNSGTSNSNSANVDLGVSGNSGPGNNNSANVDLGVSGSSGNSGNGNSANVDLGVSGNSGSGNSNSANVDLGVSGNSGNGNGNSNSGNVDLGVSGNSGNSGSGNGNSANVDLGVSGNSGNGNGNAANVDLSVGVGSGTNAEPAIDVGLDVDLGLDVNPADNGNGNGNGNSNGNGNNGNSGNVVEDVTDVVESLLRRPGNKK